MTTAVAAVLFFLLLTIALAHLLWAMGWSWPIRDEKLLVRTVIGMPGVKRVPRLPSFGVTLALLLAAWVAVALASPGAGAAIVTLGVLFAAIFALRGGLGYTRWWRERTPEEPFRTLDQRNYSPLCLAIAFGFVALLIMRSP